MNTTLNSLPSYILFDWDGVLADTHQVIGEAYQNILAKMNMPLLGVDELKNLPGLSLRNYFPKVFKERAEEATNLFYEFIYTYHLKYFKIMPDADMLLAYVHSLNIPMSIISNKLGNILREEVKHMNWEHYFQQIVGSKDCIEDKPSPIVVKYALSKAQLDSKKEVWFIGDSVIDMECAHKSNLISVLIHKNKSEIISNYQPDLTFSTCKDLKQFLYNIYNTQKLI